MFIEVDTVKGFQDFLPPESVKRREVHRLIEKYFSLYGFAPLETPIVEFDELMRPDAGQADDEAVSDRFKLKDRGGRNLGLRYEFTFQLARLLKQNPNLKMPFKRYQIGEVFRDEPTGPERFRQFTQCDIDIVGDATISADAEVLAVFSDVLKVLNIESEIKVNNRKLINALIESVQIAQKKAVMKELDKLEKIGEDNVKSNLRKYADANQILTLFKLLGKDLDFFKSNAFEGADELIALQDLGKIYGFKVKVSPTLMRGLSYYTGNVFEISDSDGGILAGGGRYDKSVGKYLQKEIPAVGISFGFAKIAKRANIPEKIAISAMLISFNKDKEMLSLARKIRNSDVPCATSTGKPGNAMEYANSLGIPYVVFVGEDEIKQKKFKVKNMESGDEKLVSDKQLISLLKKA